MATTKTILKESKDMFRTILYDFNSLDELTQYDNPDIDQLNKEFNHYVNMFASMIEYIQIKYPQKEVYNAIYFLQLMNEQQEVKRNAEFITERIYKTFKRIFNHYNLIDTLSSYELEVFKLIVQTQLYKRYINPVTRIKLTSEFEEIIQDTELHYFF